MPHQIVFLIDTNVEQCFIDNTTTLSNSICLSCLRLLHFLSSNVEKGGLAKTTKLLHTPVKWSYKFFNSRSYVTKIESHKLYDFKLKYFEEFENEIQRRFEGCSAKTTYPTNSQYKPCDTLNLALMQLFADFQWENPDITSPVKGRKHKKESGADRKNLVVLFTKCPKTAVQLKQFTGKQVPDADVLLDSILPGNLFQQFCDVTRLSLYWIDTQHSKHYGETDVRSIQIVENAVGKARGNLLPLDAVVQHGGAHYSDIVTLLDDHLAEEEVAKYTSNETSNPAVQFLPTTTVLSSWFRLNGEQELKGCGPGNGTITIGETKINIATVDVQKSNLPKLASHLKDYSWLYSCDLKAYGVLEAVTLTELTVLYSCVCHGVSVSTGGATTSKTKPCRDGAFEELLEKLAVRQASLILTCSKQGGHQVLLQPLTTTTATLSVISQGSSLCLEKQLIAKQLEITSLENDDEQESCDSLVERLVGNLAAPKHQDVESRPGEPSGGRLDGRWLDRWQIPGPSQTVQSLIMKLNSRISALDFLSPEETGTLKQLQKMYKHENKPPGLRDTPIASHSDVKQDEELCKFELPYKGKSSRASLSRTEMILNKSKAVVRERDQVKDVGVTGRLVNEREKLDIAQQLADFSSIEELKAYLTSTYERVSTGEISSVDSTIQMMVTVALHYIKQHGDEAAGAQERCRSLLQESVLLSGSALRDKHSKIDSTKEHKIAEYECQVMLRLEIMSTLDVTDQAEGDEDVNDEIVGLLRTLSFMSESGHLNKFMQANLLQNYIHTIPRTLANIYDELMQPLPESLASILSPDANSTADTSTGDNSVFNCSLVSNEEVGGPPSGRTRSHGSVGPPSSQPPSNKSLNLDVTGNRSRGGRKLVHHPSLADFGAKRQIVVQKIAKPKTSKSAKKNKDSQKKSRDKVTKALFEKPRGGSKLERRQSVAVMQSTTTSSKSLRRTPRKSMMSPKRKCMMSPHRRLVTETPSHKQVGHALTQGKGRQRHISATNREVIEESPEKAAGEVLKDTPTKGKRAKALLRRSFYSAGPTKRTKNLTQYFQLADRIAGRHRNRSGQEKEVNSNKPAKLLSFNSTDFMSPEKNANNSSFLLSQLISSPSPAKQTPKKLRVHTPSKVMDSPSQNTRTKHIGSPVTELFKSPSSRARVASPRCLKSPSSQARVASPNRKTRVVSPRCRLLQSPVSRRQSPQVLAPESDTKRSPGSPHTTPQKQVKGSVCGIVSIGLDSPSGNTRQKSSQTPTRKSVRAALFAKSPVANRTQSPGRSVSSPRTLLAKFGASPCKQQENVKSGNESVSSRRTLKSERDSPLRDLCASSVSQDTNMCSNFSAHSVKTSSRSNTKTKDPFDNLLNSSSVASKPDVSFAITSKHEAIMQKTPSPKRKKVTKTPDSFDKWHRRKPRTSQSNSPAINKTKTSVTTVCVISKPVSQDPHQLTSQTRSVADHSAKPDFEFRPISGTSRNKRSLLLSPEKSATESPSKRFRTHDNSRTHEDTRTHESVRTRQASFVESTSVVGSQGFSTAGSFNDLSQASNVSLDCLSITNDEVFTSLSGDVGLIEESAMDESEIADTNNTKKRNRSGHKKRSLLTASTSSQGPSSVSSPRNKALVILVSDDASFAYLSDNERSDSPIFGASRSRNRSGGRKSLLSQNSDGFDLEAVIEGDDDDGEDNDVLSTGTPTGASRISPSNKKYSPNVSAKSLMHLIQSPLVRPSTSPLDNKKGTAATRGHSRRSLKLNN